MDYGLPFSLLWGAVAGNEAVVGAGKPLVPWSVVVREVLGKNTVPVLLGFVTLLAETGIAGAGILGRFDRDMDPTGSPELGAGFVRLRGDPLTSRAFPSDLSGVLAPVE